MMLPSSWNPLLNLEMWGWRGLVSCLREGLGLIGKSSEPSVWAVVEWNWWQERAEQCLVSWGRVRAGQPPGPSWGRIREDEQTSLSWLIEAEGRASSRLGVVPIHTWAATPLHKPCSLFSWSLEQLQEGAGRAGNPECSWNSCHLWIWQFSWN